MVKLSVVISAYNEEKKIEECLKSLKFADEIIFVDNSSTDKTVRIARKYTDKIFIRPNNSMLNINKNFGFSKASGDWILSLDADERISPELKEETKNVINNKAIRVRHSGEERSDDSRIPKHDKRFWTSHNDDKDVNGYWIPRKNIIFGKWIRHTGWYPDHQLRLFKKGRARFPEVHVHEMIDVEGETGWLKNNIIHYNYETIFQFMQKLINIYAPNEAEQMLKKGYKFVWQDAIRMPIKEFLSRFFAREGYKDGFHGLMLSMLMAFYHFVVFAIIWEKQGFKGIDDKDILKETETEFNKAHKDVLFWIGKEKIKQINNPIKKSAYKLLKRLS